MKRFVLFVVIVTGYGEISELVPTLQGYSLFVEAGENVVSSSIRLHGGWQPQIELLLQRIVKPGSRVLHLGGHIGHFDVLMGKLMGSTGSVDVFEPNPETFGILKKNIELHALGHMVTAHNMGAWSSTVSSTLYITEGNSGGSSTFDYMKDNQVTATGVELVKLDDYLPHAVYDIVFLDVEGAELHALNGAREILSRSPDAIIVMEWCPHLIRMAGSKPDEFLQEQVASGKHMYLISAEINMLFPKLPSQIAEECDSNMCDILISRSELARYV